MAASVVSRICNGRDAVRSVHWRLRGVERSAHAAIAQIARSIGYRAQLGEPDRAKVAADSCRRMLIPKTEIEESLRKLA